MAVDETAPLISELSGKCQQSNDVMGKLIFTSECDSFIERLDETKVSKVNVGLLKIAHVYICGFRFDDGDITCFVACDIPNRLYDRPIVQSTHCGTW
jgi:hypothetical protein